MPRVWQKPVYPPWILPTVCCCSQSQKSVQNLLHSKLMQAPQSPGQPLEMRTNRKSTDEVSEWKPRPRFRQLKQSKVPVSRISEQLALGPAGHLASWEQGTGLATSASLWPRFVLQAQGKSCLASSTFLSQLLSQRKRESAKGVGFFRTSHGTFWLFRFEWPSPDLVTRGGWMKDLRASSQWDQVAAYLTSCLWRAG